MSGACLPPEPLQRLAAVSDAGPKKTASRGGRPKKAAGEARALRLPNVRLTVGERLHIEAQAATARMLPTRYVRELVLGHRVQPITSAADDALLLELNRIGVNLNQLARALNSDRPERADLSATLDELRRVLAILAARA